MPGWCDEIRSAVPSVRRLPASSSTVWDRTVVFIVVTALALTSLVIALFGFKQIKDSTEQPMLTTVSV